MRPRVDDLIVALVVRNEPAAIVHHDLFDSFVTLSDELSLLFGDDDVTEVEGETALEGHVVPEVLDIIEELCRDSHTADLDHAADDVTQALLTEDFVDVAHFLRYVLVDEQTTHRGVDHMMDGFAILDIVDVDLDRSVEVDLTFVISDGSFLDTVEGVAVTLSTGTELGDVVQTEHHVLRRNGDRRTIGRVENIVRSEHKHLRFENSFVAEREVDSHLVTVEVRVEGGTGQRMELNSLTLDHLRLEGLDTETVKCRSTVQEDGMALHDVLEDIPYDGILAVYDLLSALNRLDDTALDELTDDEGLVELSGHILRQTALVHLQLRADDDDRTGRVVDTLTEEVLTEATLLTLEAIGEGLERTVIVGAYSARLTRVVEE